MKTKSSLARQRGAAAIPGILLGTMLASTASLGQGLFLTVVYAIVGTLVLIASFKAFDRIFTKIDFEQEIGKGNVAAGIFCAAILIAVGLIIAAAISG